MAVDLSVFGKQKTIVDQQQLQEAFRLKKQMAQLQELGAMAQLQKALQPETMTPYQAASLDLQREKLRLDQNGGGTPIVNPDTGEIEYQPQRELSATEQKAFEEQQQTLMNVQNAKGAFSKLKEYQGKPMFSGFGATALADADTLPLVGGLINDEKAANTRGYQNLVMQGQYAQLKNIFPGAISNAEREALEKLGSLASYTPQQQAEIIKNSETGLNRLELLARKRAGDIASGRQYIDAINPVTPPTIAAPTGNAISYEEYFK
jgi:hypothetical protein